MNWSTLLCLMGLTFPCLAARCLSTPCRSESAIPGKQFLLRGIFHESKKHPFCSSLMEIIRGHWAAIEIGLHRVWDVVFREDLSTISKGLVPQYLAAVHNASHARARANGRRGRIQTPPLRVTTPNVASPTWPLVKRGGFGRIERTTCQFGLSYPFFPSE